MTGKPTTIETPSRHRTAAARKVSRQHPAPLAPAQATQRRIIVIGTPSDVPRALEHRAVTSGRFTVDAILAIDPDTDDVREIGTRLLETMREHQAEAVLIAGPVGRDVMRTIADLALIRNCELLAVIPTEVLAEHEPIVVWTGDSPLIQLTPQPWQRWQLTAKRVVDVVMSVAGLIVMAPVLALLALLISLESPGAPLFEHERVGFRGRRFKCLKLRTMRVDAEEVLKHDPQLHAEYVANHFKIPEHRDPRTTTLGRLLRRTSLDEVPQLWNVLRGEMSIVGPRPVVEEELAIYGTGAELLLSVRPGITGAWAVNGRHDVGYPERCTIELSYVRNWQLTADFGIALKTVRVLFQPESRGRAVAVSAVNASTAVSS